MTVSVDYKQLRVVIDEEAFTHSDAWEIGCYLRETGDKANGLAICAAAMCVKYTQEFVVIYEKKRRRKAVAKGAPALHLDLWEE